MKINILTLFPEMFVPVTDASILGRANENGILDVNLIDIRDFSRDRHRKTDDTPFGGGVGMVMTCQPVFDALRSIEEPGRVLYMSPRGRMLDTELIRELSEEKEFTVLCGHYEGIDQRIINAWNAEEVSIGDYVLTGGELAAMVLIDAVSRFVPGVLGDAESASDESIYSGLLEYDQYTKPREYEGMSVPDVITGGNHKEIMLWQLKNSLRLTAERRPDLLGKWIAENGGIRGIEAGEKLTMYTKRERKEIAALVSELSGK